MINRRQAIGGRLVASAFGATLADSGMAKLPDSPELDFLKSEPLLHESRARFFMEREGLDALVVSHADQERWR